MPFNFLQQTIFCMGILFLSACRLHAETPLPACGQESNWMKKNATKSRNYFYQVIITICNCFCDPTDCITVLFFNFKKSNIIGTNWTVKYI